MQIKQVEALEKFYLDAIDIVKELQAKMNSKSVQDSIYTKSHNKIWGILGIEPIQHVNDSGSDEFIQSDASFYAAHKPNEDTINLSLDS